MANDDAATQSDIADLEKYRFSAVETDVRSKRDNHGDRSRSRSMEKAREKAERRSASNASTTLKAAQAVPGVDANQISQIVERVLAERNQPASSHSHSSEKGGKGVAEKAETRGSSGKSKKKIPSWVRSAPNEIRIIRIEIPTLITSREYKNVRYQVQIVFEYTNKPGRVYKKTIRFGNKHKRDYVEFENGAKEVDGIPVEVWRARRIARFTRLVEHPFSSKFWDYYYLNYSSDKKLNFHHIVEKLGIK